MIEGEVEVTRNNTRIPIRGGSELFGEMALLTNQRRNSTVTTLTSSGGRVGAPPDPF
jgi:CRP-like cAMP-binding protein